MIAQILSRRAGFSDTCFSIFALSLLGGIDAGKHHSRSQGAAFAFYCQRTMQTGTGAWYNSIRIGRDVLFGILHWTVQSWNAQVGRNWITMFQSSMLHKTLISSNPAFARPRGRSQIGGIISLKIWPFYSMVKTITRPCPNSGLVGSALAILFCRLFEEWRSTLMVALYCCTWEASRSLSLSLRVECSQWVERQPKATILHEPLMHFRPQIYQTCSSQVTAHSTMKY